MKNWLIPALLVMAVMLQSCGPSEEERQKLQAENERIINEKVDEIMQKLDAPKAAAIEVDSVSSDSTTAAD